MARGFVSMLILQFFQILETVISISDPQKACDALIASVKELEQYSSDIDNTSVLLVYFGNEIWRIPKKKKDHSRKRKEGQPQVYDKTS